MNLAGGSNEPPAFIGGSARRRAMMIALSYTHEVRRLPFIMLAGSCVLLLAGCVNTAALRRENDRLRAEMMSLEDERTRLERRISELETELARGSRQRDSLPEAIRANTPHITTLDLSRLCHARDDNGDDRPDRLVLYVNPADSFDRFVQIVGTLTAHAAILPAEGEARTINRITLDPAALRDAYRSSFTGTHYTVEMPIDPNQLGDVSEVTVRVIFTDGETGREFTAERAVSLVIRKGGAG